MQPWAAFLLEKNRGGMDLSIRPAAAYRALRSQPCFRFAEDWEIRRAIWTNAAKINLSIKRPDKGKYSYWPPSTSRTINNAEQHVLRASLSNEDGLDLDLDTAHHCGERWTLPGYSTPMWVTLPRKENGLPSRERWVQAAWDGLLQTCKEQGWPPPAYQWPTFRVRLLTQNRLGKAAMQLPFCCPMCCCNERMGTLFGGWFVEAEFQNRLGINPLLCIKCANGVRALHNSVEHLSDPQLRHRIKHICRERANDRMSSEAPLPPPKKLNAKERKAEAEAIAAAVYELGLIEPGELVK